MSYSLNEVEATAKRAARGAGYSWGLAEEAGKATRWLCAQGLDGTGTLARLLEQETIRSGERGPCPLSNGAYLSDSAHILKSDPIVLRQVECPLLLVPFAAYAARRLDTCIAITCDGAEIVTDGTVVSTSDALPNRADHVEIRPSGDLTSIAPQQSRATPNPGDWETLNRFAHRTYAPATDASRLLGAGAGLSDND